MKEPVVISHAWLRGGRAVQLLSYLLLTLAAGWVVFPFLWGLLGAFKPGHQILRIPPTLLADEWTLQNFRALTKVFPIARIYANSLFVSTAATGAQIITSATTGYALARFDFPGRQTLFLLILSTMMVPFFVVLVPLFVMVVRWGWLDTYHALIVPVLFTPFGIFLLRQFSMTIPNELLDAARIDGANELRIFVQIAMPILTPAMGALGIFAFTGVWGDFLWPLFVINTGDLRTLPVALSTLVTINPRGMGAAGAGTHQLGILMAGDLIVVTPVLVVFFIFQRYITRGVALTGMGGH